MTYAFEDYDQKPEVQKNLSDTLTYYPKRDGAPSTVVAASAYVTILDPGGTEVVARTAATIASNKLTLTRTWDEELSEDYIAVWEWQEGTTTYGDRQTFDVVLTKLPNPLDTSKLQELYPDITSHLAAIGEPDATKFARRAWSMILDRIRSGGNRPALVMDRRRLINPALQLMAALVANTLSKVPGDLWDARASAHMRSYQAFYAGLGTLKYDRDEEGLAGGEARVNRRKFYV